MLRSLLCTFLVVTAAAAFGAEDAAAVRCYELRTYTVVPGRMPHLQARFRDHSIKLLEKHGMKLLGFWTPVDKENVLVYLVQHDSREAAQKSWTAFRADPEWIAAKKASEEGAGGGSLTEKVESVVMNPTDFSAMK
jgi:NIPSNAP protein